MYTSVQSSNTGRDQRGLVASMLFAILFLQRFAMPFGDKPISLVGPLCLAIAAWGWARGTLVLDRRRLIAFLALAAWILVGMVWQALVPNGVGGQANIASLAQFLVLTGFACLTMRAAMDEADFFALVTRMLGWIAIAGLLQFAAQLVGLRLFQFTGLLPGWMLYETDYNLVIPVGVGALLKANGFFLIEPSVFSQFMAIGLIAEVLTRHRPAMLLLFLAAMLLSFSGTGWLVLGSFLVTVPFWLGRRGVAISASLLLLVGLTAVLALIVAPDLAAAITQRAGEFGRIGTSAQLRFVTPFWILADVTRQAPWAWLTGIGSGASETLRVPYLYNVNTPIKILLEYGLPALCAYLSLFLLGRRARIQRALVCPLLVLFLFGGGYQQFPPVLFFVLLLLCVARPEPRAA